MNKFNVIYKQHNQKTSKKERKGNEGKKKDNIAVPYSSDEYGISHQRNEMEFSEIKLDFCLSIWRDC